jgi:hypothetical protein
VRELKADGLLPAETKLRSSKYLNNLYKFLFDLTDGKNWPARFHTAAVCSFS